MTTTSTALLPEVSAFLSAPVLHLIDGLQVPAASGEVFTTYNPCTGEPLTQVAFGGRRTSIGRSPRPDARSRDRGVG